MGTMATRRVFGARARGVVAGVSLALAVGIAVVVAATDDSRAAPSHVSTVHAPLPHTTTGAS
jgi:hypothetical protein